VFVLVGVGVGQEGKSGYIDKRGGGPIRSVTGKFCWGVIAKLVARQYSETGLKGKLEGGRGVEHGLHSTHQKENRGWVFSHRNFVEEYPTNRMKIDDSGGGGQGGRK